MKEAKKGMKEIPKGITLCNLQVVLMPNGEIICKGNTVGWFKNLKECLSIEKEAQEDK